MAHPPQFACVLGNCTSLRTKVRAPIRASVLIGVLWCVALLAVVVIGVLHTARMDLLVVKNYGDRIQARYLAVAGIERAKALLYQDARTRTRSAQNHSGRLFNASGEFRDVSFGRGAFRVFRRGRQDEGGGIIYGVSDEESRLNVNYASSNELAQVDGMTPDIITAILGWRGALNTTNAVAGEAEYYASLRPPAQPRAGALETVRELLMVRGVTSQMLFGDDEHQNGFLPNASSVGDGALDSTSQPSDVGAGWAGMFTVDSSVNNVNASGQTRVNVQTADESTLKGVPGISPDIARAIVAYRGQHPYQSIADLLDVTAAGQGPADDLNAANSAPGRQTSPAQRQGQPGQPSGPRVISPELLMDIADDVTTVSGQQVGGAINLNTASLDVLACLPGLDRQLAQAIVSYRQSSGFFPNIAWLLKVPGLTQDIFKQVAPLVSARSETYRILSEGTVNSTGVRQRVQAIVHVGLNEVTTLSYREDDL
jgi:competence ComEA-like helix-hairpin-helix protein